MKLTPFEKRVKRRITGREHSFFAICSPGLKKVCLDEMLDLGFPEDKLDVSPGGIEFRGRLEDLMQLSLNLRSPSRILMRVASFKADSFEKLQKKTNGIDWILYLQKNTTLKFNVTAKKSRLYHSDAIAQRCEKIIGDHLWSNPNEITDVETKTNAKKNSNNKANSTKKSTQTIFIRAENDRFTLSLDASGDLLFKRGIKKQVSHAPLRENIAAAMLHWTDFSKDDTLIDPMCGSGTFSIEAAMIQGNLPPGFFRSFAFEQWPGFSKKAFAHMKKQARKDFIQPSGKSIFASDVDESALDSITENISKHNLSNFIQVEEKDFFSITPPDLPAGKKGVILINPPYGKRIGVKSDNKPFFQETGKKLAADFKGWRVGIIFPSRECKTYLGLRLELKPIFHGGLELFAGIGTI
jgi:putative N6-adenine-specific DNA methylase